MFCPAAPYWHTLCKINGSRIEIAIWRTLACAGHYILLTLFTAFAKELIGKSLARYSEKDWPLVSTRILLLHRARSYEESFLNLFFVAANSAISGNRCAPLQLSKKELPCIRGQPWLSLVFPWWLQREHPVCLEGIPNSSAVYFLGIFINYYELTCGVWKVLMK